MQAMSEKLAGEFITANESIEFFDVALLHKKS